MHNGSHLLVKSLVALGATKGFGIPGVGVHTAMQNSVPMILFVGQVGTDMKGRDAFQKIDCSTVFGTMAKWAVEIDRVERIPVTFNADPRKNPTAKDAVAGFQAKGCEPEAYTLYSYAAMQVLKQAADEAKFADARNIAGVMHSGKAFKAVLGNQSFDKKGIITHPDYVLYVWKKGANAKIDYPGSESTN